MSVERGGGNKALIPARSTTLRRQTKPPSIRLQHLHAPLPAAELRHPLIHHQRDLHPQSRQIRRRRPNQPPKRLAGGDEIIPEPIVQLLLLSKRPPPRPGGGRPSRQIEPILRRLRLAIGGEACCQCSCPSVIASEARQSSTGSPRRCAPRDDEAVAPTGTATAAPRTARRV